MSRAICVAANCLDYPEGGGHLWAHLNWALAFAGLGYRVWWLEMTPPDRTGAELDGAMRALAQRLAPYGLADALVVCSTDEAENERLLGPGLDAAASASELLVDFRYDLPATVVRRFRRSAMMDIDPGELQVWMSKGEIVLAPHDRYFTIGETVGSPDARFPDGGVDWHYTPPCIALDWWEKHPTPAGAAFTTVAHWYDGWMEDAGGGYIDGKRIAFLPFLELPRRSSEPLELALDLAPDDEDWRLLRGHGWRVCDAHAVAATPWAYHRYIQDSRGEFSCVKPHCVRLQNAWISDRTLCYLASGKPAVVQHTGPSRFLPEREGLYRFHDLDDAAGCLESVMADYDRACVLARSLAETYFSGRAVAAKLLGTALA